MPGAKPAAFHVTVKAAAVEYPAGAVSQEADETTVYGTPAGVEFSENVCENAVGEVPCVYCGFRAVGLTEIEVAATAAGWKRAKGESDVTTPHTVRVFVLTVVVRFTQFPFSKWKRLGPGGVGNEMPV